MNCNAPVPPYARRVLAAVVSSGAAIFALSDPGERIPMLTIVCIGIALATWRTPWWISSIPLSLVVGDWYPVTGSLLVTESDIFLLALLAGLLWRNDLRIVEFLRLPSVWLLWAPLLLSVAIGLLRGWSKLPQAATGDQLSLYASQWNSLRIAKGFLLGSAFVPFVIAEIKRSEIGIRTLCRGMKLGALVVGLTVIVERSIAYGIFEFETVYRPTGTFVSMHIGGQHIDAFWAIALPFLFLSPPHDTSLRGKFARVVLIAIAYYAVAATMSRVIFVWAIAAGCMMLAIVNAAAWMRPWRESLRRIGGLSLLAVAFAALAMGFSPALRSRFASVSGDWETRWTHWQALCSPADANLSTRVFGLGLGALPTMSAKIFDQPTRPAELVSNEAGTTLLRLRPGKSLFVEQLVNTKAPAPWKLRAEIKSEGMTNLHACICEKSLYQSFRCVKTEVRAADPGRVQLIDLTLDIYSLQSTSASTLPRPTTFALSVSGDHGLVDVSRLELNDAVGNPVLRNIDFGDGSKYWFFTSDDLKTWHANNLWVHLYVEQGWLGVLSFAVLVLGTLTRLAINGVTYRDITCGAMGLAIVGILIVGVFDSILDAPNITELFFVVLAASQAWSHAIAHDFRTVAGAG